MVRCLQLEQFRSLLSSSGSRSQRRSKAAKVQGDANSDWSSWYGHDLSEAARAFRKHCIAAVQATEAGDAALPLVDAACEIVESLLTGVGEQMRGVRADVEVRALQASAGGRQAGRREEIVSLEMRLGTASPLVGEIATRSRVAVNVQVTQALRFALLQPPARPLNEPVALRVEGLDMPTLPDCVCARTQMREELGAGLNPTSAYEWWEQNRHTRFPLQTSKFHRVVESLLEQRGMKLLGSQVAANSFWGYLHTTGLNVEVLNFHFDKRMQGGVTVTALLRPPKTEAEAADREQVKIITKQLLTGNRSSADRLAPSGINVGAMIAGPEVGQPGAHPRVIAKLLSGAQWWGVGEDSWHRWDETWLCTDKKDLLGRVVKQQGRIIWRESGTGEATPPTPRDNSNGDLDTLCVDAAAERANALDGRICFLILFFLLSYVFYSIQRPLP